jgi:hypothetical protein
MYVAGLPRQISRKATALTTAHFDGLESTARYRAGLGPTSLFLHSATRSRWPATRPATTRQRKPMIQYDRKTPIVVAEGMKREGVKGRVSRRRT